MTNDRCFKCADCGRIRPGKGAKTPKSTGCDAGSSDHHRWGRAYGYFIPA